MVAFETEDSDDLLFADEDPASSVAPALPWRVLVVDDDQDVHEATDLALRGLLVFDRPLQLLHAYSAADALSCLRRETDIAVILLDVVMESLSAGLDIIETIRGELALHNTRIILRTGQPGYAPEIDTIRRYDINDYKTKTELTRSKLFTTLSSALRTYHQLCQGDSSRRGLEQIVVASRRLMLEREMRSFSACVLEQLAEYLGVPADGMICAGCIGLRPEQFLVLAGQGRLAGFGGKTLGEAAPDLISQVDHCAEKRHPVSEPDGISFYLGGVEDHCVIGFLYAPKTLDFDRKQLEVLCANIALGSDNVRLFERLRAAAFLDPLTGLPNRTALINAIDQRIESGATSGMTLALVDIDQFSAFNDLLGHHYGDQLLQAVGQRMRKENGAFSNCLVSRVSNDTFAILGPDVSVTPEIVRPIFQQPFVFGESEHSLSVSIGLLRLEDSGNSGADCLKDAWVGIRRAKAAGQGQHVWYTRAVGIESRERTRLLSALRQAFESDRMFVVYQPQICLDTNRVIGVEALLRWRAEDGCFISPVDFIPLAESSGLIVSLGEWVLRRSLNAVRDLQAAGHGDMVVAVNVSAMQFRRPDFLNVVDTALVDCGVAPDRLELEVTESVAIMGAEMVESIFAALKTRGISLAIDDFGTGFSSLSYLDRLPADRIKIDRAFVNALDSGERGTRGARIAEMVVPLGHRLGMKVLAEGVETEAQVVRLRELGCDEVQGYLYARPMPLADLLAWLAQRKE